MMLNGKQRLQVRKRVLNLVENERGHAGVPCALATRGDPAGRPGPPTAGAGATQEAGHVALSFETHRRTTEKHHILRKATNGLCLGLASCEKAASEKLPRPQGCHPFCHH